MESSCTNIVGRGFWANTGQQLTLDIGQEMSVCLRNPPGDASNGGSCNSQLTWAADASFDNLEHSS